MKNKFEEIEVNIDATGVCEIILNRPNKHNAMNRRMIDELEETARYLTTHESVRLVFLQANGTTFCAGGDLNWMKDQEKKSKERKFLDEKSLINNQNKIQSQFEKFLGFFIFLLFLELKFKISFFINGSRLEKN